MLVSLPIPETHRWEEIAMARGRKSALRIILSASVVSCWATEDSWEEGPAVTGLTVISRVSLCGQSRIRLTGCVAITPWGRPRSVKALGLERVGRHLPLGETLGAPSCGLAQANAHRPACPGLSSGRLRADADEPSASACLCFGNTPRRHASAAPVRNIDESVSRSMADVNKNIALLIRETV